MWRRILRGILGEPTLLMTAIRQSILWGVAMYWFRLDEQQIAITMAFVESITTLINRALVVPVQEAEAAITRTARTGIEQSVRIFVVLVLTGALVACGARTGRAIAAGDDLMHDGLARFDDLIDARCDADQLSAEVCRAINRLLVPTWDTYITANRAAREGDLSKVPAFTAAVNRLIDEVKRLVATDVQQLLVPELERAKTQVRKGS